MTGCIKQTNLTPGPLKNLTPFYISEDVFYSFIPSTNIYGESAVYQAVSQMTEIQ